MQDILLLKAAGITYAEESPILKERILNQSERLLLKDISLQLYRGQVLGILGKSNRLTIFKEIFNRTLSPTRGRITTERSVLSLDVMDHINSNQRVVDFTNEFLLEFKRSKFDQTVENNLKYIDVYVKHRHKTLSELSRRDIAVLLIELSKLVDVDIIIFCNLQQYLYQSDKEIMEGAIQYSKKRDRGVMLLESRIENIVKLSNYFMWLSYGQIRFEGSVKKGHQVYTDYLKEKSQIKSLEEESTFDTMWKENMNEHARFKHNLERLKKKTIITSDNVNVRKIVISVVLFSIMVASAFVMTLDISFTDEDEITLISPPEEPVEATPEYRTLYGIVTNNDVNFGVEDFGVMDIVSISRDSNNNYLARVKGGDYEIDTEDFIYFNPGSLYPSSSLSILLPFTHASFRDNYLFYSNYLNIDADQLKEQLNYSFSNNQRIDLEGISISFHLKDDRVYGMSFPSTNISELKEEAGITAENPIFRLPRGYMILNEAGERWLYINR